MQWSPGCLASLACLVFSTVGFGACARPTVEEAPTASDGGAEADLPDTEAPEPDAGTDEPDAMEEPDGSMQADAGCADRDRDTVCDAQDNCPDVANSNQADADKNGIGDACSQTSEDSGTEPTPCNAETIPASAVAGDATLSNVRVNGMSSPVSVTKGQQLSVALNYAFGACSLPIPGQPRFLVIGIEGAGSGECRVLIEVPCPTEVNASTTLMVNAPNRSGPAYIVMLGRQGFSCSDSLSGAKRVAALCVE
jgi:hypothetical protein